MNTSIETFLQEFHKLHPGCTPAAFSQGRTLDGQNSYDRLMSVLPTEMNSTMTVLDLACGDGVLLQKLSSQPVRLNLMGVDMSVGELDAARARLTAPLLRRNTAHGESARQSSIVVESSANISP